MEMSFECHFAPLMTEDGKEDIAIEFDGFKMCTEHLYLFSDSFSLHVRQRVISDERRFVFRKLLVTLMTAERHALTRIEL